MGIPINVIFFVICIVVFLVGPAIKIVNAHLLDERSFLQYWLKILFEKWKGNRRSVIRILQIVSLFIAYWFQPKASKVYKTK